MDWLVQIVPDAKSFEIVANVLIAGLVTILTALPIAKGAKKYKDGKGKPPDQGNTTAEIAGAIIDNSMAKLLVSAIEDNTEALKDRHNAQQELSQHLGLLKAAVTGVHGEAREINSRLEGIKDEIIRRSR